MCAPWPEAAILELAEVMGEDRTSYPELQRAIGRDQQVCERLEERRR